MITPEPSLSAKDFDPQTWKPTEPVEPLKFNLNELDDTVLTQTIGTAPENQYIPEMIPNGSIIYEGPLSWASKFSRKLSLFSAAIILPLAPLPWFLSVETLTLTSRLVWSLPLFLYPLFSVPIVRDVCNPYVHNIMLIKSPEYKGGILDVEEEVPPEPEEPTPALESEENKTPDEVEEPKVEEVEVVEEVEEVEEEEEVETELTGEEKDRLRREDIAQQKEALELEKDKTEPIPPNPYENLFSQPDESDDEYIEVKPFPPRDPPQYRYNVEGLYLRLNTTDMWGRNQYWTVPVDDLEPTWGNLSGFNNYYSKSLQKYFAIQDETLRRACGQEWLWFYFICKHELSSHEIESYEDFVKEDKRIRETFERERLEMEQGRKLLSGKE